MGLRLGRPNRLRDIESAETVSGDSDTMLSTSPKARPGRDLGLDTARAFATFAMVVGHTLDGLLDQALRSEPLVATYWRFRGLTAPMFLLVSGWAVATVISRSKASGRDVVRARLPRIGLLFFCGFFLRLPTWGWRQLLDGSEKVWRHTIAFDALHCIAASMLVGTLIFAAFKQTRARLLAFSAMTVLAGFFAQPVWDALANGHLIWQQWVGAGSAPFTLLPWAGYFAAGAVVGVWSAPGVDSRKRALILAAVGVLLVAGGYSVATTSPAVPDARLFSLRLGQVLAFSGAFGLLPDWVGHKAAPLGRASLGVYVVHLPVIYGWGSFPGLASRWGKTLSPATALFVGLTLLAFSYAVTVGWNRARAWMKQARPSRPAFAPPAG